MTTLYIVLPIFNEAQALPVLLADLEHELDALPGYDRHYVLTDDGSSDDSPSILDAHSRKAPTTIITHPVNRGLGATIRDGLSRATSMAADDDIIVTLDADCTHPTRHISAMIPLVEQGHDIVVASRFRTGASVQGLSLYRHILTSGARLLYQLLFPTPGLRDYTCGYRAYRASLLAKAFAHYGDGFIECDGFAAMADILLRLRRFSPRVAEVPLELRYDKKPGASKMPVLRTVFTTLAVLIKRRLWG